MAAKCSKLVEKLRQSEQFVFLPFEVLTAEAFPSKITDFLSDIGLDVKRCNAQAYDGASVMSGANKVVQKLIRDSSQNPCPCVHCYAHRLNLVLTDVAKRVDLVADTIGLL